MLCKSGDGLPPFAIGPQGSRLCTDPSGGWAFFTSSAMSLEMSYLNKARRTLPHKTSSSRCGP